jgi:phosphopantothenoylcysteine decarboxylase/phosphopantothenate--cysteine ligase
MGFALASEAAARGADVILVLGPGTGRPPGGASVVAVTTAEEMRDAVLERLEGADALVMAAAVADFRPEAPAAHKLKKDEGVPQIRLARTPDILEEVSARKRGTVVVGFAAETGDLEAAGRRKLDLKDLDLIVVNEVGREGTGFGSDTNRAMVLSRGKEQEPLREWTKRELARAVLDRVADLLQ